MKYLYLIDNEVVEEKEFVKDIIKSSLEDDTDVVEVLDIIEKLLDESYVIFNNKRYEIVSYGDVIN